MLAELTSARLRAQRRGVPPRRGEDATRRSPTTTGPRTATRGTPPRPAVSRTPPTVSNFHTLRGSSQQLTFETDVEDCLIKLSMFSEHQIVIQM